MKIRDFHLPGRSPVYAREGMAATSHPLASLAAIETLKAGGTAADAAVAAVAVLCVVEPAMTGIGGDCFCLVAKPEQPVWGYNGSGRAAAAVTTEKLLAQGMPRKIPAISAHAVTVPGAIEAWESILQSHGRFGLDRVLQHAIGHAENGFAIAPILTDSRGLDVVELRPNGQGLTARVLLNILEQFDVAKLDPLGPERLHLALEAARLAFGVRDAHIADPASMRQPVASLIDKG